MFALGLDEEEYYGHNGPEPSQFDRDEAQKKHDKELKRQVRAYGAETLQSNPTIPFIEAGHTVPMENVYRSLHMVQPGAEAPQKVTKDPLADLMKQMGLTMGPDIVEANKKAKKSATVVKLPDHDDRGATPIRNPQKRHVSHPSKDDHGLCLATGFCAAYLGSVSSGKTTTLLSCAARNHARWRYDNVWLMHPDAQNAIEGEYGLCKGPDGLGIKILDHWPAIEWWEKNSPGRTALICDDLSWELSRKGTPSQYALAERTLAYMRSHKEGSMDIYIGQQQIYGIPAPFRKLVSTWFIFPRRTSPSTYHAIAAATMLDKKTLERCLSFVENDFGFLLVDNLGSPDRARVRVNGWRAVRGVL